MGDLDYKIISISGNARCGKDTLGENFLEILKEQGINCQKLSFADELKKSVDSFLIEKTGISAFTNDDAEKKLIRPFLVCWGTDIMRSIDDNIWIKHLEKNLKPDYVNIITDLRFQNELKWVKKNKGLSIFLERDGVEPANDYELYNNSKIKPLVDLSFKIGSFDDEKIISLTSSEILNNLINENIYELWKATCH